MFTPLALGLSRGGKSSRTERALILACAAASAAARLAGLLALYALRFLLAPPETASGLRRYILQAAPLPPVQTRTGNPYGPGRGHCPPR